MSTPITYPHVLQRDGEPARLARFPRIRVAQIAMDHLAHAWSADQIQQQYPHLHLAEIHAALAYYFDHQDEVDREIAAELTSLKNPPKRSTAYLRLQARGLLLFAL